MRTQRTTWFVTPEVTVAGTDYLGQTPPEALNGMGGFLTRIASVLHRQGATEWRVLVDEKAAARLGLSEPATDDCTRQRALDSAAGAGWRHGKLGGFTSFFGNQRPTVHVCRVEVVAGQAIQQKIVEGRVLPQDPESWPWGAVWHPEITSGLQHWHRLTGVAWQAGPAVMGLELMHRTMTPYRLPDVKGQRKPDLRDDSTPHDAVEAMWSREMWYRPEVATFAHGYDKRRAGITAAGVAKVSPAKLQRYRRKEFDPRWAGWWHVTVSPWNRPELPHPMGPGALDRHRKSMWVTTPTMELCAELAERGEIAMPEVIDSLTGPARPVLAPWQKLLESTYGAPSDDDYHELARGMVQSAVKVAGVRGIGMLGKADGRSSIWRPDWFHAINATKRANAFRKADRIGRTEGRWPVALEDDLMWYASEDADPVRSAPKALQLAVDMAGGYRVQHTVEMV